MAVYAAYRHIELDNIGYGKKRVLKPPGGGSSDIFGADASEPARARNTNHLQSSMFGSMMETTSPKSKQYKCAATHSRLFGDEMPAAKLKPVVVDDTPVATLEPVIINEMVESAKVTMPETVVTADEARSARNPINHVGMTEADCTQTHRVRSTRRADGNPVTGEGYAIANGVKQMAASVSSPIVSPVTVATTNGTNGTAPKTNGTANASVQPAQQPRGRVPPGGFSSGLW